MGEGDSFVRALPPPSAEPIPENAPPSPSSRFDTSTEPIGVSVDSDSELRGGL
jgi:hypothetical protein